MQTLYECRERRRGYPAVVHSGKIAVLEKTLAGMGDDEPILAGKKVLEKELEKLQKKLNGPKKTAKHIEAKQNWINRESKRLEAETARLTEPQESLRVRKETLKVAYEETKILREDLLREGRNDGQKQEPLLVSRRHRGNPEARTARIGVLERVVGHETVRRRKSLVGCWKLRDSTKKSKQRRENCKRRSRGNQGKMPEWETMLWMVWMVLCRHEGANTDIASNIRVETACGRERIRVCRVL